MLFMAAGVKDGWKGGVAIETSEEGGAGLSHRGPIVGAAVNTGEKSGWGLTYARWPRGGKT